MAARDAWMGSIAAQDTYNPDEGAFQAGIRATPWFDEFKVKYSEEPNLEDPNYDYRAAWKAGARPTVRDPGDNLLHWDSRFKGENHPNRYVGGVDTKTGQPIVAIEDRRDTPDMTPEWRNVPGSLASLATHAGNYLWGTPRIPEAPDTPLSDALGKRDIKLEPKIHSRSPLDQAIDVITDEISMFRKPGKKLGSDIPFTQREFSPGLLAIMGALAAQDNYQQ